MQEWRRNWWIFRTIWYNVTNNCCRIHTRSIWELSNLAQSRSLRVLGTKSETSLDHPRARSWVNTTLSQPWLVQRGRRDLCELWWGPKLRCRLIKWVVRNKAPLRDSFLCWNWNLDPRSSHLQRPWFPRRCRWTLWRLKTNWCRHTRHPWNGWWTRG